MSVPTRRILAPTFGNPVLRQGGTGKTGWVKDTGNAEGLHQKSTSGFLANLYGGVQSGDDWAAVYIPVDELPLPQLASALWTYRLTNAEACGINMVVWAHDPADNDKRVEITQVPGLAPHADGWNAHELDTSVSQFFYYGENEGSPGTCTTEGTNYTWAQYQTDSVFLGWTIYRISFEYGWIASSTLDDAWLCDVKLNGQVIPLKPCYGEVIGRETKQYYSATPANSTVTQVLVTPAATKRIRVNSIFLTTASATASVFEVYFHTGANITTTAAKAIMAASLDTDTQGSAIALFGDNGPLGDIGEVVSMRTSVDITTNGGFTIVYREE